MNIRSIKVLYIVAGLVLTTSSLYAENETLYTIKDGKVDIYTHVGWKVFNMNCYGCHGVDAVATDVAPDLLESLKEMTKNEFITKVLTRYRITLGAGQATGDNQTAIREAMMAEVMKQERAKQGEIIMPAWSQSPYVKPHVEDLYSYLKARSDGVLGAGEPEVVEK